MYDVMENLIHFYNKNQVGRQKCVLYMNEKVPSESIVDDITKEYGIY